MSTILQALQKSKFDQAGAYPPPINDKNTKWKIAFISAFSIIIALLVALLYLLLNPRIEATEHATINIVAPITEEHFAKVSFETKPLPPIAKKRVATPKPVVQRALPEPVEKPPVEITAQEAPIVVSSEPASNDDDFDETEINYTNTPEDLKKRFELALMMSEIEQEDEMTEDLGAQEGMKDGSDIREMSSNFQDKVPFIRYDSHMYSSILEERWIRINGETLKEGEFDSTGQLQLIEIQPQRSIFRLERQSFSIESLTDWKGY